MGFQTFHKSKTGRAKLPIKSKNNKIDLVDEFVLKSLRNNII